MFLEINLISIALLLFSVVLFISLRIGALRFRKLQRRVYRIEEEQIIIHSDQAQLFKNDRELYDRKPSLSFLDFLLITILIAAVFYGFVQLIKRGWI